MISSYIYNIITLLLSQLSRSYCYYLSFYSFSRLINGTDIGQDYDLDDLFYLLYGRRAAGTV